MRYYNPGDDIYFFGFSRGAYTARFLAEMLDHVGLLSAGNEELTRFAWKTFSKWQARRGGDEEKEDKMYKFMENFRKTFSRPVRRIRFLGLFYTVNSVPKFESAWMQRTKFPYSVRSSAKVIRHAVAINERRAKFRQDLISSGQLEEQEDRLTKIHRYNTGLVSPPQQSSPERIPNGIDHKGVYQNGNIPTINLPPPADVNHDVHSNLAASAITRSNESLAQPVRELYSQHHQQYHSHEQDQEQHKLQHDLDVPNTTGKDVRPESIAEPVLTASMEDIRNRASSQSPNATNSPHPYPTIPHKSERLRGYSTHCKHQDIEEVWFPGCHADIGGGWAKVDGEHWPLSHTPLVWMVWEAESAGLKFDKYKMADLTCCPDKIDEYGNKDPEHFATFHKALHQSGTTGFIHDCLEFGGGLPRTSVLSWKMMEYLPFRRMDLKEDGSWKPIHWPLPGGETRDIPNDARIHNSAIKRMQEDHSYRPGNLIVGGGGRGIKIAPKKDKIGKWKINADEGNVVRETYVRVLDEEMKEQQHKDEEKKFL